jgi:fatty-acyl-CoA synthase
MAAVVLRQGQSLTPEEFEAFLAEQADLSPKAWPTFVRINDDLPQTATNKILKRQLSAAGATAGGGTLWERSSRSTRYQVAG